jgi:hypothetical protein
MTARDDHARYSAWKGWEGTFSCDLKKARYFAAEFRGIPLRGQRVLEVGFGNGAFMAWARDAGADVHGIELNEAMRVAARQHGFVVHDRSFAELVAQGWRCDLVVAFDVIEHWDSAELVENFGLVRELLHDGGLFLARCPNGHSPFGRVYQHGDLTHKSTLSAYKLEYLAGVSGLDVVRIANPCRVSSRPGILRALRQRWLQLRRHWIERSISRLYGIRRLPLDPNLMVLLRRPLPSDPSTDRNAS